MKKYVFRISIIFFAIPFAAHAQNLQVGGGATYGTFKMQALKDFLKPSSGFYLPVKVVDNFPSNIGYNIWASMNVIPSFSTGLIVGLNSTGGRSAYSDYTGSFTNDILVSGVSVASTNRYLVYETHHVKFFAGLDAGVIFNRMEVKTNIVAEPAFVGTLERKAKSTNVMVSPGISASRSFHGFFVNAKLLYEFNAAGALQWTNSVEIMNSTKAGETVMNFDTPVTVQWDGIRLGVGVGYNFNRDRDEQ